MSTIAYAVMTDRRLRASVGRSEKADEEPPGMPSIIDGLTALVPAEVLIVHTFLASQYVESGPDGMSAVITDPLNFGRAFYVLAIAAPVLFLATRFASARGGGAPFDPWDIGRALIPLIAFCSWAMLLEASSFDAQYPAFDDGLQLLLAVTGYLVVVGLGTVLGRQADRTPPA